MSAPPSSTAAAPVFAVLFTPAFRLQAALREEPAAFLAPSALFEPADPRPVVLELSGPAARAGVQTGQPTPQALARCPNLRLVPRHPDREQTARDTLLHCALAASPEVEWTAPGVCTLALARCPKALDNLNNFARDLLALAARAGFHARLGVAPLPDLALLTARAANPIHITREIPDPALDALPIAVLEPPPDLAAILDAWGIRTLGAFAALPAQEIAARLGAPGLSLLRQARPTHARPIQPVRPPERFLESAELEAPAETLEPILFLLRRFLDRIALRLECARRAATALELDLRFEDGARIARRIPLAAPTAEPAALFRVLHTFLDTLSAPAPVTALALEAIPAAPRAIQTGLFENAIRDPNRLADTLAQLDARLGPNRVGCPVPLHHLAPGAFTLAPPSRLFEPQAAYGLKTVPPTPPGPMPIGLPLRRFRPPQPAQVTVAAGHPTFLATALHTGPVEHAAGPWRASGEWWTAETWTREEWDVRLANGQLLRLAKTPQGWLLEGLYD